MATVGVPMGKRNWIFVGVIAFALVVFLAWAFWTPNDRDWEQEEKIKDLEHRVARLQKELEESPKQIASLRAGSDETTRARRSAQRTVNNSRREAPRLADRIPSPEQASMRRSGAHPFLKNHLLLPESWHPYQKEAGSG